MFAASLSVMTVTVSFTAGSVAARAGQPRAGAAGPIIDAVDGEPLPGGDLVRRGLNDLESGIESVEALLVSIGGPRLRALGIDVPDSVVNPEHRLYEVLSRSAPDAAHSRYNALIRRLVSFERALACGG